VVLYRARFFSNGGSDVTTVYTDVISAFRAPEREGYTFDGWYTSYDLSGSRALSPYTLLQDTDFYAKWLDNRRCNVKFIDEEEVLLDFDVVYGDTVDIDNKEKYPDPTEKEGKVFKGWRLMGGSNENITQDIRFVAVYESVRCTVQIEFWDGTKLAKTAETVNYGNRFSMTDAEGEPRFTMPTMEGYTSRWVIYPDNSDTFIEFPEGQDYVVVKEDFSVRAQHDINTYVVTVFNGKAASEQDDADLKSGDIKSAQVYYDPATYADFRVDYGKNFRLSGYTQTPYLKEPTEIVGYNSCWCYVITTLTGEEWRNQYNEVWDEESGTFVVKEGEERSTNFVLSDRDGNYLCTVRGGDLYDIKGNVSVRAKYYKKDYSVRLLRREGTQWVTIGTFTEKYRTDFKLYDPEKYVGSGMTTWQEVESFYLLHNVATWSFDQDVFVQWRSVYFNGGNTDDWNIEWYSASGQSEESKVDFSERDGEYGYYEIRDNLDLYCKDIDLRRYTVVLLYDYDFATGTYRQQANFEEITENETVIRPAGSEGSVIRRYPEYGNKSVTYEFEGWYDYPYEPDGNGEKGDRANFETRTRNVKYYAHYKCETTYRVAVYDRTQREKYADTPLEGKNYDVAMDTIFYDVPAGTLFTSDMIYKGTNIAGVKISGDKYYAQAAFMESVLGLCAGGTRSDPQGPVTVSYESVVLRYDPNGDLETALTNARAELAVRQKVVNDYLSLMTAMYGYNYEVNGEVLDKTAFVSYYLTATEYDDARRAVKDVEDDIETMLGYEAKLLQAQEYYDADQAAMETVTVGSTEYRSGLYKRYSDSPRDLNAAYGKDYIKSLTDGNEKIKYKFSGWYLDETYSEPYNAESRDLYFEFFASSDSLTGARSQLDLYAKWADEEKGSEGLVFRAAYDSTGNIVGVVVVDYMTKAEYEASSFFGCEYNNFAEYEFSVNFNDSEIMPSDLGKNIDLQIPAGHGGRVTEPYPVLCVMANAFRRHGIDIKTVTLPDDIAFFEESAFRDCYLTSVTGKDNAYITVDEERALYQIDAFSGAYLKNDGVLTEIRTDGNTLIVYASKFATTNLVDGSKLRLLPGTEKIGSYALYAATNLKYVAFGDALVEIGERAFENSALSGSDEDTSPDTLILPDALRVLRDGAFRNCVGVKGFDLGVGSSLSVVGRDAVTSTGWYNAVSQKGVICLNGLVVGVRDSSENDFATDDDNLLVEDGMYYYENAYGVIYYTAPEGKSIVKIVLKDSVRGVADYAFENSVGTGSADKKTTADVEIFVINGPLSLGIAKGAFKDCAALTTIRMTSDLSPTATLDKTAFVGCGEVTIILIGDESDYDDSWSVKNGWRIVTE
ncbi:MAG: InlB B-repeat-containing protein, partial [Clostridia bacterium]|nr:InlB B-repeat-containing protein [Clostridia bacterium]